VRHWRSYGIEPLPCPLPSFVGPLAWHLELAGHEVVMAKGLPTESYLDTGNRAAFAAVAVAA
jgi:hypothetical protein